MFSSVKTSPFGWIAGSGFSSLRPSSSVIVSRAFAAASAIASAEPGSTTAVGVIWRSLPSVTAPKRPYSKNSRIDERLRQGHAHALERLVARRAMRPAA